MTLSEFFRRAPRRSVLLLATALLSTGLAVSALTSGTPASAGPPAPTLTISAPPSPLLGENFTFTATFTNASSDTVGYGPFADLIIPVNGFQGVNGATSGAQQTDGITYNGATFLGSALQEKRLVFPAGGTLVHPYTGEVITGTPGDMLVVLTLPFGSFTPTQPAAAITVSAGVSNLATLQQGLTISGRGGFRFGSSATGTTPIVQSPNATAVVTPSLITTTKTYVGPEKETSTGPNSPRAYTVTADTPPGRP